MNNKYKLNISLSELSSIQIAKYVWKHVEVKKNLASVITGAPRLRIGTGLPVEYVKQQRKLAAQIGEVINKLTLPKPAEDLLLFVTSSMGLIMKNWLVELLGRERKFQIELECLMDHICWRCHGTLDSGATMRSLYLAKLLPNKYDTWLELSYHCLEDCIADFNVDATEINQHVDEVRNHRYLRSYFDVGLSLYWYHQKNNSLTAVTDFFQSHEEGGIFYNDSYSIHENMFILSFVNCNYEGVQYFWNFLDDTQRRTLLIDVSQKLIEHTLLIQWSSALFAFGGDQDIDLVIFYIDKLRYYELGDYWISLLKSDNTVTMFLKWPYQGLFMECLEETLLYQSPMDYSGVFGEIIRNIHERTILVGCEHVYRRFFYQLWESNLENLKDSIIYWRAIFDLGEIRDVDLLNCVINDKYLTEQRTEFLHWGVEICSAYSYDTEFVEKFIHRVLTSDEERVWFRNEVIKKQ